MAEGDPGGLGINSLFTYEAPVSVTIRTARYWKTNLTRQNNSIPVFMQDGISKYCMQMMQIRHPNILRLESVIFNSQDPSASLCFLQEHNGDLKSYILNLLRTDCNMKSVINQLQRLLIQILEVLEFLIDLDLYHGDFSLENTYCVLDGSGSPTIKLANFFSWDPCTRKWDKKEVWSDDFYALGKGLDDIATTMGKVHYFPRPWTREIVGLATLLKNIKLDPLNMRSLAMTQPLFWRPHTRTSVFIHDLPMWMEHKDFCVIFEAKFKCPPGWESDEYFGLLNQMNNHRVKKGWPKYNGKTKIQFLRFVCGSYTHEDLLAPLSNHMSVDAMFRHKHPDLCVNIWKIVDEVKQKRENANI